jgi:pimeloyl-ACP methyl ester carboxylesterase
MPRADLPTGASIYYEEHGTGFPVLLFAPGGMDSRIDFWHQAPWDPTIELSHDFRVIAMDQRNAHRSFAPLAVTDWATMAADHAALLDHLGIERAHLVGGCIGSSYCLRLIHDNPERVTAAVCQNPIGLNGPNFDGFKGMFAIAAKTAEEKGMEGVIEAAWTNDRFQQNPPAGYWAARITAEPDFAREVASMDPAEYARIHRQTSAAFFERSDWVFSVTKEWVATCPAPLLILAGHDDFHPTGTAREIAQIAPDATLIEDWAAPADKAETVETVIDFLKRHTP